jgi:uncharacterized lipoprotein YddW (UPF0748 family)
LSRPLSPRLVRRHRAGAKRTLVCALLLALAAWCACGEAEESSAPAPAASPAAGTPAAPEPAPAAGRPPRRALWVLAEGSQRVLEHPERVPALLSDARALGATDLFVQVYRGGRAWFDSSHADAGPHRAAAARAGTDPLRDLIARAHEAGLRVHAWVNVLSLAQNRDAPIVKALGADVLHVDRRGRSLLDYPKYEIPEPDRHYYRMGTPGLYVDPGAPGVAAELVATFAELVTRYPELDGLHLDYIRYPDVLPFSPGTRFGVGLDFGYGAKTRARFRAETGREAPLGSSIANADAWDTWRREQVDAIVRETARAARVVKPEIAISAAVWTYADRAYQVLGQDWRRWLEEGWLDFAVPMAYTTDDRLLRYQTEAFAGTPLGARIWPGLGVWLFAKEPARAVHQLELARASGAPALALFSWDSIAEAPALRDALAQAAAGGAQRGAAERSSEK